MHKYFVKLPCELHYYMAEEWKTKAINPIFKSLCFHVQARNKDHAFNLAHSFASLFTWFVEGDFEIKLYSGEKVDYSITKGSYKVFIDEKSFTTTERNSEKNE